VEVHVTRTRARLEALKQAGVDVGKWMQKAENNQKTGLSAGEVTPNLCTCVCMCVCACDCVRLEQV